MKFQLWTISKITLASLFIIGCGGDKKNAIVDTTEYDLSQYLVPSKSQTNVYQEFTYEKENGESTFSETGKFFSNEKYDVNGSNITITIDNELSETVVIGTDKIVRTFVDEDGNETMVSARTAQVGDSVISGTTTRIDEGVDLGIELECKLARHYDERDIEDVTYEDVLLFDCTQELIEKSITLNNVDITVNGSGTVKSYFAKDIGLISYVEEGCSNTTIGNNSATTDCYKDESNLITVVK